MQGGDVSEDSDMDIVVILNKTPTDTDLDYISSCAWEAGFKKGIVIVPVVSSRYEWENSPERYSLLSEAVAAEGITI